MIRNMVKVHFIISQKISLFLYTAKKVYTGEKESEKRIFISSTGFVKFKALNFTKNADYSRQKTDKNEHIFNFEHGIIFRIV